MTAGNDTGYDFGVNDIVPIYQNEVFRVFFKAAMVHVHHHHPVGIPVNPFLIAFVEALEIKRIRRNAQEQEVVG